VLLNFDQNPEKKAPMWHYGVSGCSPGCKTSLSHRYVSAWPDSAQETADLDHHKPGALQNGKNGQKTRF
jgi:hypothetical protein